MKLPSWQRNAVYSHCVDCDVAGDTVTMAQTKSRSIYMYSIKALGCRVPIFNFSVDGTNHFFLLSCHHSNRFALITKHCDPSL